VIDFLCKDGRSGDFVVIELKKGRGSDRVLGQCQRYMGWVQENLAARGERVRGLIIAPEQDERLRYALKVAPNVDILCYRVSFQLIRA
jgi:RecB family endonuclease NucS